MVTYIDWIGIGAICAGLIYALIRTGPWKAWPTLLLLLGMWLWAHLAFAQQPQPDQLDVQYLQSLANTQTLAIQVCNRDYTNFREQSTKREDVLKKEVEDLKNKLQTLTDGITPPETQ